jgi:hypothetical protein
LPTAFPTVDGLKYDLDMLICYILTVVRGKSVDKRLLYLFRKAYVTPHDYIQGKQMIVVGVIERFFMV